jgi:hypothetical protein
MLPIIKAELSGVNSTIELKDFKTINGTIRNLLKLPKVAFRKGRRLYDLAQVLRAAADLYLQYKFNIAPLISDVQAVRRALANTERRLNGLVSRMGKLQTRHYSRDLHEYSNSSESEGSRAVGFYHALNGGTLTSYATATNERIVVYEPSIFHAQVQYNYYYTDYQLEHARILSLLDAWGVNLNPAIIWNAIPWSFVVDWLVDVSRWLSTTRVGNMDPKINIMQYLWSVKRARRIVVTSKVTSPIYYPGTGLPGSYPPESMTHPVVFETAYRRDVGLPSASSLTTSGLSPTEISLGAALGLSRWHPHRRK